MVSKFTVTVYQYDRIAQVSEDEIIETIGDSLRVDLERLGVALQSVEPGEPKSGHDAAVDAMGVQQNRYHNGWYSK